PVWHRKSIAVENALRLHEVRFLQRLACADHLPDAERNLGREKATQFVAKGQLLGAVDGAHVSRLPAISSTSLLCSPSIGGRRTGRRSPSNRQGEDFTCTGLPRGCSCS